MRRARQRPLQSPRNLAAALDEHARTSEAILVSLVGSLPWPNPTVYADPGVRYDWSWADAMGRVILVVKPGVDASDAMRGLFAAVIPYYLGIADIEARQLVYLTGLHPEPGFMRFPDYEQEFFA